MNSNDLLDIVGEAKEEHVLDAVNTRNGVQPQKKRLSLNRAFLIAAVIAMMLLLVGCTIAYVLSLQDLKIAEEDMVSHYGDDGKRTSPTEVTVDVLSLMVEKGYPCENSIIETFHTDRNAEYYESNRTSLIFSVCQAFLPGTERETAFL